MIRCAEGRFRAACAMPSPMLIPPFLAGKFPTHKAYAEATVEQVLAMLPKPAGRVQAADAGVHGVFQSHQSF